MPGIMTFCILRATLTKNLFCGILNLLAVKETIYTVTIQPLLLNNKLFLKNYLISEEDHDCQNDVFQNKVVPNFFYGSMKSIQVL